MSPEFQPGICFEWRYTVPPRAAGPELYHDTAFCRPPTMTPQLQSPVPSPCINVCEMAPDTGLCRGCMRTLDEIVAWGGADDDYKRAVWAEIRRREAQLEFR